MDDNTSIALVVILIIALIILFWQRNKNHVSPYRNRSTLAVSKEIKENISNTDSKYYNDTTDIDNKCKEYLSYVKEGIDKKYCKRLQSKEDTYKHLLNDHEYIREDDKIKYCDCPPDLNDNCLTTEYRYNNNGNTTCRSQLSSDDICTCSSSDYDNNVNTQSNIKDTEIAVLAAASTANNTNNITVSTSNKNGNKIISYSRKLQQDELFNHCPNCNIENCTCPRLSDKSCPENWTQTITSTNKLMCSQNQKVDSSGCAPCYKSSFDNHKKSKFCSCSTEVPSCGCSDFISAR